MKRRRWEEREAKINDLMNLERIFATLARLGLDKVKY